MGLTHQDASSTSRSDRLVHAVRDLAAARGLDDVVDIVRHAARELAEADGATFVLRDAGHCFYVDEDAIEPLWRGQRFPLDSCISGWAMLNAQAVHIPDIYVDPRVPHAAYRPTFVKSLAMTPVRTDEPVAAIGVYWADHHETTPEEIGVLQALADTTAVALENVRILAELEQRVEERTSALAAANADLASFAHLAAHDLRSPLATISMYAQLIASTERSTMSDRGAEALDVLDRQARRMAELIDVILAYSKATTTEIQVEQVDMAAVAAAVAHDLQGVIAEHGAQLTIGALPAVPGSRPLLERVLQNLIANAVIHGRVSEPQVMVDGEVVGDEARVRVSDNGTGVALEDRERIFEMFTRGSSTPTASGSGVGLAFARRVVERHGGTLTVGDGPSGGACFTITLPADG